MNDTELAFPDPQLRHFGTVRLAFGGSLAVRLADGRRATVSPREPKSSIYTFKPGDSVVLSVLDNGGNLSGFDVSLA